MDQLAECSRSDFGYSPLIIRGTAGRAQLVTLRLLFTRNPWISWQCTAAQTSVTLPSSSVGQLAEHSWSHFCYSPLITRGSAGRVQLVTLLLLSTHNPWISWQSVAGQTSVTLHSSSVGQLAEHSWSHFGYSSLVTRGSVGSAQLLRLTVTLHSSSVGQLAEHSWSHFCYSPLITRGSAGRVQLVTLPSPSTHHPWISWQSTAGHTSATLHSSPIDQLTQYSGSHFCYSPLITSGSASKAQLVTLLLLTTHHQWISWQSTAGHTSVTLHLSHVDQLAEYSWSHCCYSPPITRGSMAEYSWSHFCYSPLITRGSADRVQLVTLLLLSTHHPWISWQSTAGHTAVTLHPSPVGQWQSTAGHTSVTLHSSPVDQLAEYLWSHFGYSPLITRGSAGMIQLVTLLLLSTHDLWISWQSAAGQTSVTLHSSSVGQLAEHSWSHFGYSSLTTRGSAGKAQLVTLLLLSTYHP